jgi:hypothetical protein
MDLSFSYAASSKRADERSANENRGSAANDSHRRAGRNLCYDFSGVEAILPYEYKQIPEAPRNFPSDLSAGRPTMSRWHQFWNFSAAKRWTLAEAHAWVEFDGAVLNDSEVVHRHYKPFERDLASLQMETR